MPAEFQKAIDLTLTNCSNAYLDDILIVKKEVSRYTQTKTPNGCGKV